MPVISPPGFNASEDAQAVVVFRCVVTGLLGDTRWRIDGRTTSHFPPGVLEERGIVLDEFVRTENQTMYIEIRIRPTAENNATGLQCTVLLENFSVKKSQEVLLRVQGEK